ncbi:MAG TPA: glycine oxidase ThiO [Pirellulales bacterium]|nr:glycine oxidase ThiO [Pirellulales bacterium]
MDDCLIIGAGVVGLSLAYELASAGARVRVIDRQAAGREASWAGAGILPAATDRPGDPPYARLAGLSHALHKRWADELRALVELDNGFRPTGALYVACDEPAVAALEQQAAVWKANQIAAEELPGQRRGGFEPHLGPIHRGYFVPDECQIRNPWHLRALLAACQRFKVAVSEGVESFDFVVDNNRINGVETNIGRLRAKQYCVATGSWTAGVMSRLGVKIAVKPVRGQMVLLRGDPALPRHIINHGSRYLVPRGDGRVLVGSTEEDVGYDRRNTAEGVRGLLDLAARLVPPLATFEIERTWAGLRPATADGLPYLGRIPGFSNAFIAAGHFRSGLHLSPGTARVVGQAMRGVPTEIDLTPFRVDRG